MIPLSTQYEQVGLKFIFLRWLRWRALESSQSRKIWNDWQHKSTATPEPWPFEWNVIWCWCKWCSQGKVCRKFRVFFEKFRIRNAHFCTLLGLYTDGHTWWLICTFHDGCKQGIDQQIFNRKSISRKITHPQSWKLQAKLIQIESY